MRLRPFCRGLHLSKYGHFFHQRPPAKGTAIYEFSLVMRGAFSSLKFLSLLSAQNMRANPSTNSGQALRHLQGSHQFLSNPQRLNRDARNNFASSLSSLLLGRSALRATDVAHVLLYVRLRLLQSRATHLLDQLPPILIANLRELVLLIGVEQRRDLGVD